MDKNVKMALIIGGIIVAVLIVLPTVLGLTSGGQYGDWGMMGPGMMGGGMMGGFGWTGLASVLWLVLLGVIIWAIVAWARGISQPGGSEFGSSRADSALEVLKKRYARGEIGKEEFEEKKKDLI